MHKLQEHSLAGTPRIKIAGIGGAGIHILYNLYSAGLVFTYLAFDSSAQCLAVVPFAQRIQLGGHLTNQLGCGAKPELGRQAAQDSRASIERSIENTDLLILIAGLGGGLASGALPIISGIANGKNIPTLCFVSRPFLFEGKKRQKITTQAIDLILQSTNGLLIADHNKLLFNFPRDISLESAMKKGGEHLQDIITRLLYIIQTNSLINIDFADIRTLINLKGMFAMGSTSSRNNLDLAQLIDSALDNPLSELERPFKAKGVLLFVEAGPDFNLDELSDINLFIEDIITDDTLVIMGINSIAEQHALSVTILATGIQSDTAKYKQP